MLKIGIVSEYYYPLLGGISENVHNTATQLVRMGHEVKIITSNHHRFNGFPSSGALPNGIPKIAIGRSVRIPWNGSVTHVSVGFSSLWTDLRRTMFQERFDLVHVHSPLVFTLPPMAILASPCKSIATFHSYFDHSPIYAGIKGLLQKHFLDKLDGQIAVSQSCVRALTPYFRVNPRVIPNGIDTNLFTPSAPRLERFGPDKVNLLFLSRLEPRNGLDVMLKAFALVRAREPRVRLIIVGDGPLRAAYEKRIPASLAGDVHFEGARLVERPSYYATADIYCAPISRASFGMTLLEAMATGRPIVATENDGFRDLLSADEAIMVPTGDHAAFAEAILALIADPARRRRMGEAGLAKATQYAWPRVTEQLVAYYEEVLGRRG